MDTISRFDTTIRRARWLAMAIVVATIPYDQINVQLFIALTTACALFNATQYIPIIKRSILFTNTYVIITIDLIFIAFVLSLAGGAHSAYVTLLLFPVMLSTFQRISRHIYGILYVLITEATILTAVSMINATEVIYSDLHRALITVLLLCIIAYFVNQLSADIRSGRSDAQQLRSNAESERQKLVTLIESMDDGVMAVNADRVITMHNEAMRKLLAMPQLDKVNLSSLPVFNLPIEGSISFDEILESRSAIHRRDLTITRSDNSVVSFDMSVAPLKRSFGSQSNDGAFIIMLRDITAEKDLEDQRREFLSIISHELRTPVASAEAGVSMLLNKKIIDLEPKAQEFASIAYKQILFLAELINEIGTLSKLEDDSFTVEPEALHCKEFLQQIFDEYSSAAENKGIELKIESKENLPVVITSIHEVKEILQNFITNAVKYTETGSVTVRAQRVSDKQDGIILSVTDSGIGIAQNDINHVFDKFYRSEDYRTRRTGGTGLGLYICQKLSDRLGARIWVESIINKGSTFYLQLPPFSSVKRDQKQVISAQVDTLISSV